MCAIPMCAMMVVLECVLCYDGGTRVCAIPMCAMLEVLECVLYLCVL